MKLKLISLILISFFNQLWGSSEPQKLPLTTWGSYFILTHCWSSSELQGHFSDKQIQKLSTLDLMPPARLKPVTSLPILHESYQGVIRAIRPNTKARYVALTFDCCELANSITGYDYEIVNYLRSHAIPATFFLGGKWMRSHPEKTMQLIADPLFEIGNHTWTHGNLGVMPLKKVRDQVLWTQAQYELFREEIARRIGQTPQTHQELRKIPLLPRLIRLPYGRSNFETLKELQNSGFLFVQWDVVGEENVPKELVQQVALKLARKTNSGSIILLHANAVPKGTSALLPYLVEELQAQGYIFVTVSELLSKGEPIVSPEGYFSKPGDNLMYDKIYGDGTHRLK